MDLNQDYSSTSFASLEYCDPDGYYWRTSQRSLLGGFQKYSSPWPVRGMMQSGKCYRHKMSGHRTGDEGSLSKASWPTPTTDTSDRKKRYAQGGMPLSLAVKLWPTPTVHGNYNRAGMSDKSGDGLATAVKREHRQSAPMTDGSAAPAESQSETGVDAPTANGNASTAANGPTHSTTNTPMAANSAEVDWYPTPTACQGHNAGTIQEWGGRGNPFRNGGPREGEITGFLNPTWVEWLMGFPGGWTALEESETLSSRSASRSSADSGDGAADAAETTPEDG